MFDIEYLEAFADDTFTPRIEDNLTKLICDMQKSLESITTWLWRSEWVVSWEMTEVCLFYKRDMAHAIISMGSAKKTQ